MLQALFSVIFLMFEAFSEVGRRSFGPTGGIVHAKSSEKMRFMNKQCLKN